MKKVWLINCKEDWFPGMWQRWYKNQCVAVGWPPPSPESPAWTRARNALNAMQQGDAVIVALRGNRVGRIGYITGKAVKDDDWSPLVPRSNQLPQGEMGRRVFVRWDMTIGPDDRDRVVHLPEGSAFNSGQLRPTLCKIPPRRLERLKVAMNDPNNWVVSSRVSTWKMPFKVTSQQTLIALKMGSCLIPMTKCERRCLEISHALMFC